MNIRTEKEEKEALSISALCRESCPGLHSSKTAFWHRVWSASGWFIVNKKKRKL